MLQIPSLGENEIIQVIREYLSGLAENSPLKDVFAAWAERLIGDTTLPRADTMVVPDPEQLESAALAALAQEQARVQLDPSTPDLVQIRTQTESPTDAAVDLANEARYLDEDTGPCDGCAQPLPHGDEPYHQGPGDHPVEPVEPLEPHIVIPG